MSRECFYVTTPIYYPNNVPHVGTAYTTIAADCTARFQRMLRGKDNVFFLTGTDEHGQKIEQAAREKGQEPKQYVDKIVAAFQEVWASLNISNNDFIRTTEERHESALQKIFQELLSRGQIYKSEYEGLYCIQCETFWLPSQLVDGSRCPNSECNREVQLLKEEGYFFKLSDYSERLLKYIEEYPYFIRPESRKNEVVSFIKQGLQDLCITRKKLEWGVRVPGDPEFTIYVWLDALCNYLTSIGYPERDPELFKKIWPANVHLLAKDILRFHAIIWPAMLMALELPLPDCVFAHGWLVMGGYKVSKSNLKGGARNLREMIEEYGADSIRYFLLREGTFGQDMEFSEEALIRRHNSELGNDLGNLLNRTLAMLHKYCGGIVPEAGDKNEPDDELLEMMKTVPEKFKIRLENLEFRLALETLWDLVVQLNQYVERTAPWQLKKEGAAGKLNTALYNLLEGIRRVVIMAYPFMPGSANRMFRQLGYETPLEDIRWDEIYNNFMKPGTKPGKGEPVFPKIEAEPAV
ncbi:MAG: methionine--tRNA ligase [Chloroflexi bacterium]|nr:methionine--tRNA ligase [Chloroflexota bacterium]